MKSVSMQRCQALLQRALGVGAAILLAMPPAWADHQKMIGTLIINVGVVPAVKAAGFAGEAEKHGATHPSGAHHVLVSLSNAAPGGHVAAATVLVEIRDPKGKTQRKVLALGGTAGIPDYSEVFVFGWSGKYRIRVIVERKGASKPLKVDFTWTHAV